MIITEWQDKLHALLGLRDAVSRTSDELAEGQTPSIANLAAELREECEGLESWGIYPDLMAACDNLDRATEPTGTFLHPYDLLGCAETALTRATSALRAGIEGSL